MSVGFYTIMRLGELLRVKRLGVRVVFFDGDRAEQSLSVLAVVPDAKSVAGLLIHVVWRKSRQDRDAWVPLAVPSARFGVAARAFVAFVALFVGTPLPVQRVREAPSSQPFEFQSLNQVDGCVGLWWSSVA